MHSHEYHARYDQLPSEDAWLAIPGRIEFLLERIGRGKRVLDVGCLGGKLSRVILERNNEVWGVEINALAAEAARERGIRVKVGDVEEGLPFDDDSFDVVHAGELLEHLYDTKVFFEECRRVLRPGGALLFSAPNLNSLQNRLRVASGGYLEAAGAYPEDHHGSSIRVFNLAKLGELCARTGFELVETRGIFLPFVRPLGTPGLLTRTLDRTVTRTLSVAARLAPGLSQLLLVHARVRP
jgi:methionine biosynthesis protein MetW